MILTQETFSPFEQGLKNLRHNELADEFPTPHSVVDRPDIFEHSVCGHYTMGTMLRLLRLSEFHDVNCHNPGVSETSFVVI